MYHIHPAIGFETDKRSIASLRKAGMSQTYPYALTFPTAIVAFTMPSAPALPNLTPLIPNPTLGVESNSYIFIPPMVSLTLEGSGAPTAPLPIEFPVASVFTSGNVIHTSIGFMTYANPGAVSAAASAALSQFLHSGLCRAGRPLDLDEGFSSSIRWNAEVDR